ncbi:vinculin isoform X4 [Eurytemora carolleeae]|uniref:vinculin isoform X4 n=1 Tax=Eurytemora carolleeae TaxID=1294199 RepID=UPI000C78081B|nr:vinculin isoform X4 [Eurytemora carolleeae]XP_023329664.1 vinculin isoform X4 [Eurytemora carolleeae]|eukprot:XP_023329663.1 vinculin-like isoform X4 [Eurytemora affinis]
MPDLERPVQAVSKAVANLAKVGREMVFSTDDSILQQDMPLAITKVENASSLLEEASNISRDDPYSKMARTKLIEGSRWILQGTSSVLLCFDESEVRKIIKDCKKVLDYLSVAEVIETMEDLVQFVRDLSPSLSKVTREVEKRVEDLTHQVHREILSRCVEQIKTLAPILICSMKIFIQILSQGGKGHDEAGENRNYLAARMSEEVGEIIRVLQLVTYDEDEWSGDNLQVMRRSAATIDTKMESALDFLRDPRALEGGVGEKSLRTILDLAIKVAEGSLPLDAEHIRRVAADVTTLTNGLCELRAAGRGTTPQAENLARSIESRLGEVCASVAQAVSRLEKSGIQQPAHTVQGRLDQARRWLDQPGLDDRGVGQQAVDLILEEARRVGEGLNPTSRAKIQSLSSAIRSDLGKLLESSRRGDAGSPTGINLARGINHNLVDLVDCLQGALVDRVVQDFLDISTPLKQFADAVLTPSTDPVEREETLENKSAKLINFSERVVSTSKLVGTGNTTGNKKVSEAILAAAGQIESLTPQLVNAGRIRMVYPENKAADEHFENLRKQYAGTLARAKALVDETTDSVRFIGESAQLMKLHSKLCEEAIHRLDPSKMVENTSAIARLANRVLQLTKQEADNSEDPRYISVLNISAEQLQSCVSPMVQFAKVVAMNIQDKNAVEAWRKQNQLLLEAVHGVHSAVCSNHSNNDEQPPLPPYPELSALRLDGDYDDAPPRPPPPGSGYNMYTPPRPPPPDSTDDESENPFDCAPTPSQGPIMMAAHDLHQEVRQWSSKDNDIIAAAKKMANLMAKLSKLVQEEEGSKRELISIAKAIAEASDEVSRLAKELAKECTDKRMRINLLQVCERIPTIGTQLKILSTVKATMLGAQGSEEDLEATEMLIGNAQNLMQSVKQTVTAAEAASIKIRTDAGIRLRWVRKNPWYHY